MALRYLHDRKSSPEEFVDLLRRSTLAERRPVEDRGAIDAMLRHANLICTAWDEERLVGVARSLPDFEFCCYLSDLSVDTAYQKHGVGTELLRPDTGATAQARKDHPALGAGRHGLLSEDRIRRASLRVDGGIAQAAGRFLLATGNVLGGFTA